MLLIVGCGAYYLNGFLGNTDTKETPV
jgi:hypothetical protein